jgi:DNA-binding beta-propeller fold protein YncE
MKIMNSRFLAAILVIGIFSSCVKDRPNPPQIVSPPDSTGRKLIIANEGSLSNGNASLSIYDITNDSLYNDVFFARNNMRLGDVLQSIFEDGDYLYLCVNNSDRITVINKHDYTFQKNIAIEKPRYIAKATAEKLYVTSIYYNRINIISASDGSYMGHISTDYPNTEGIIEWNNTIYACNWDTACNYIYEINPATDEITHRIEIAGRAPQQITTDKIGHLWVLAGNVAKGKSTTITVIDPQTRSIVKSFAFSAQADALKPAWNPTRDTLYFQGINYMGGTAQNGVFRMSIHATVLPDQPFIPASAFQFYWALGVDSVTNSIYVGDPKGFIQKGSIEVYNAEGSLLKTMNVGVGPGYFHFLNE